MTRIRLIQKKVRIITNFIYQNIIKMKMIIKGKDMKEKGLQNNKVMQEKKKNIQNIQSTVQSGNVSQGGNLTPDTQHFVRMKNAIPSLNQKIQSEFKELYNVIQLYCNYNPRAATNNIQFVPNTNISVDVEGSTLNQDLLFNQLKEVTSSVTTRKVLGVS